LLYIEMILLLFSCVLLHEFGHCFVAKHYKIIVPRIILLPIGGMAQFQRIPRAPKKELFITLAGPLVNIVIFAIIYFFVGWPSKESFASSNLVSFKGTMYFLMIINLLMGTFNLLPVFPMDGGRILRALMALKMPYLKATYIAVVVGKILALVGIFIAIFSLFNWLLAALFAFIYLGADAEYAYVKADEAQRKKLQNLGRPMEDDEI